MAKKIVVSTNDPTHKQITLICKGQILEAVTMNPKRVSFGQISKKDPARTKKVVLTRGDGGPLSLKLLPIASENVKAELREVEPGERYELEVTLAPPFKSERVHTNVRLETGVPEAPTTSLAIHARIRPRVASTPRQINAPRQRTTDWEQPITLAWADRQPHKILSATVNDPALSVELLEQNGRQEVLLKVPAAYKPPKHGRQVTIKTDDELEPYVRVPVRFTNTAGLPTSVAQHRALMARRAKAASRARAAKRSPTSPPARDMPSPAEAEPPKGRPVKAAAPKPAPAQAEPPKERPVEPAAAKPVAAEPAPSGSK